MFFLTRKEHFCAAHKLYNYSWSKEKNEEIFGGCANENWHGHNFVLYVTVKGELDPETGMVMNFKDLGRLIRTYIIAKVDHKNLNLDVDFMKGKMPSAEVLAMQIWQELKSRLPEGVSMHKIEICETENSVVEYMG